MKQTGYHWRAHVSHGELLRSFKDVGGLIHCPSDVRYEILKWLILAYLGEPGGRTMWGNVRSVFYSNTAAPLVREIISEAAPLVKEDLKKLVKDKDIKRACYTIHIERRMEALIDLVDS